MLTNDSRNTEDPTLGARILREARSVAMAVGIFLVVRVFLIQTFIIISGSMVDTLLVGDMLLVNKAAMGAEIPFTGHRLPGWASPRRGDLMVFNPPPLNTAADGPIVKRLVGLPGDTIEMRDGRLSLNGELQTEPYAKTAAAVDRGHPWMRWQYQHVIGPDSEEYDPTRDTWGPLVVPEEHYFMLGDNRDESLDSRYWGFVHRDLLLGKAVLIYFSYNRTSYRPFPWLQEVRWGRIGKVLVE